MIVQYIRNEKRVPIGVMVGGESGQMGVSLCNPKDHFDKRIGKAIAVNRMLDGLPTILPPDTVRPEAKIEGQLRYFIQRLDYYTNRDK